MTGGLIGRGFEDGRLYGKAPWQGYMAKLHGKAIWQGYMARLYGKAPWQGYMARRACGEPLPRGDRGLPGAGGDSSRVVTASLDVRAPTRPIRLAPWSSFSTSRFAACSVSSQYSMSTAC